MEKGKRAEGNEKRKKAGDFPALSSKKTSKLTPYTSFLYFVLLPYLNWDHKGLGNRGKSDLGSVLTAPPPFLKFFASFETRDTIGERHV